MRKRIRAVLDGTSTASWSVVRALGAEHSINTAVGGSLP